MRNLWNAGIVAAAMVLLLAGPVLLTWDVHADDPPGWGDPTDVGPAFCGSAYDVVLLRGDGYMGGEIPSNQEELDAQCVRRSGRLVVLGVASCTAGLVLWLCTIVGWWRATRRRPLPQE